MKKTLFLFGIVLLCLVLTGCKKKEDTTYTKMSDSKVLITIGTWQNDIAYKTKYSFKKNNTGRYTINGKSYQSFKWSLSKEGLTLTYDNGIEETLSYKLDKKNVVLKITSSSGSLQTFRKDGTYKSQMVKEHKPEELIGTWVTQGDQSRCLILENKLSGRAFIKGKEAILSDEITWSTKDDELYIESEAGVLAKYTYAVKDKKLSLYLEGVKIQSYDLSTTNYKIKRAK